MMMMDREQDNSDNYRQNIFVGFLCDLMNRTVLVVAL